jgi:carboxypeptidase Taq
MKIKSKDVEVLLEKYKEISLLAKVAAVLSWDMNVNLPGKGAEGRAQQLAYLTGMVTDKWLDEKFKKTLEDLDEKSLTEDEKAAVRNLRHQGKYYFKVPKEIIVEFSETSSRAFMAWQEARREDSFKDFLPHLKKIIKLNTIIAGHLGYKDDPYDALLDLFEPELTTKKMKVVLIGLEEELTALIKKIKKSKKYKKDSGLIGDKRNYPVDSQKRLATFVIHKMNYDLDAGRMDISAHPFTDTLGAQDIRITNRYDVGNFVSSLMTAMHEAGHALYEQDVNPEYSMTPLEGGVSLGVHESQSRFWENQVGRSYEFLKFMTPVFHAFYPDELSKVSTDTLFSVFNKVEPGFIRVEADEVTYNLHILLRFEIEDALVNEKLKPEDLPDVWRQKMKKYLGIVPETDREGVLQDVHWSHGLMGYFPTYTLGNLYAAQFAEAMEKEIDMDKLKREGEFGTILSWLMENIHRHGSYHWPKELVKKVTGKSLTSKAFTKYLSGKYTKIYELS